MRFFEEFASDLRQAARAMRRSPGFAAIAVATLALGIAAAVTVFSFVDSVFRRPLAVAGADRLVRVRLVERGGNPGDDALGMSAVRHLREHARSFDLVAAHYSTAPLYVRIGGEPQEVQGAVVSATYFPMLALTPRLGRFFTAGEDSVPDRDPVAVIGEGLWHARFAGDPAAIGRTITINGRAFTVVGVAPPHFAGVLPGVSANEIWIPTAMLRVGYRWCDALADSPPCAVTSVLARLAPGATLAAARAEVGAMSRQLATLSDPADSVRTAEVAPATGVRPADQARYRALAQLLAAIAAVLLAIACANVGGLLVARGVSREREIALRTALGAGRGRIVRQLLAESLLLAIVGGALGVGLSAWSTELLMGFFLRDGEGYVRWFDVGLDVPALAFGAGVAVATVLAAALLPSLSASRAELAALIRGAAARGAGWGGRGARARPRLWLVSGQVTLSMALLVGAGLLVRSFGNVAGWRRFDAEHVALLRLRPRLVGYGPQQAQAFLRQAVVRLGELPEVSGVAVARGVGSVWGSTGELPVSRPGDAPLPEREQPKIEYHELSPGFFATLRVPLLAGREFTERDGEGAPRVAIVNETLARRLWPKQPAVDRLVVLGGLTFRVVGVVRDYRPHTGLEPSPAMTFVPFWQNDFAPQVDARLAVRVRGDPGAAIPALRRAIGAVDPLVPVTEAMPMAEQVGASYAQVRLGGAVLLAAGALALVLSAVGLYGVMAFVVAHRTREIGIRMAIGARPEQVTGHFLRLALRAAAAGGAAGTLVALAGGRYLASWLVGVTSTDAPAYGVALAVIGAATVLAGYVPARRAARVDPAVAMRVE